MQLDVFDYLKVKPLPNSIALIPYFGGQSSAVHCSRLPNVNYFIKTFASMQKYFTKVYTYVCNKTDYDFLSLMPGGVEPVLIESDPIYLPIEMLRHVQSNMEKMEFDYVFYTEADHVLYCKDIEELTEHLKHNTYIIPWRYTKIPTHLSWTSVKLKATCPIMQFDGKIYEVRHYLGGRVNPDKPDAKFYRVKNIARAFSGSWLANRSIFQKFKFRKSRDLPIEHACFTVYEPKRVCLRSIDPTLFFVEHLSGFEQVLRDRKKINVRNLPGAW